MIKSFMKNERQTSHRALLDAFAELALSRRYQDFGAGLIATRAGVARSTFYYHFRAKDDLLLQNLKPMLLALALLPEAARVPPDVEYWVAHIWEHRARAKRIFDGPTGRKISEALALELRLALRSAADDPTDRGPAVLLADQMAGSMMGLLRGWIAGRAAATSTEIAGMLWSGARWLAKANIDDGAVERQALRG